MNEQLPLIADEPLITVHCFFGWCEHVVRLPDPVEAHEEMERHYTAKHVSDIDRLVGL